MHAQVHQPSVHADMDGFKLLETIGLELDLPVISEASLDPAIA